MSNYLVDMMTWSHSRINAYLQCPYKFYLKYIYGLKESPMFFSGYGGLIHEILADCYRGKLSPNDALNEYLIRFPSEVSAPAPSQDIATSFFQSGIACMKVPLAVHGNILGVEEKVSFDVYGWQFIGFIDLVHEDENAALCILDHKSMALKPMSNRRKPTKTDAELDDYLRQLYLYSIPISERYGRNPDYLEFNCYRSGTLIKERFHPEKLEETKRWAVQTINKIREEKSWQPCLDYWHCKFLCGFCDQCEYAQMADWR